jgi:cation transport regulator
MPYASKRELPAAVKRLPSHAKSIFLKAFNAAFKQYEGDDTTAFKVAWNAVKYKFRRTKEGAWVTKDSKIEDYNHEHDEHGLFASGEGGGGSSGSGGSVGKITKVEGKEITIGHA